MEESQSVPCRGQPSSFKEYEGKDLKNVDDAQKMVNFDPIANSKTAKKRDEAQAL